MEDYDYYDDYYSDEYSATDYTYEYDRVVGDSEEFSYQDDYEDWYRDEVAQKNH